MNVTDEYHKPRKHIQRKEPAYYLKLWTNKPPHIPFGQLFEDRKEYVYARQVISRFKRGKLVKSQMPMSQEGHRLDALVGLPVDVHSTPWRCEVPPHWVAKFKGTVLSTNRNGQLVYRDPQGYFGLVIHKRGSVQFAPYLNVKTAWDRLEAYVKDSLGEEGGKLFIEGLHKSGVQTHVAFHTPGVSKFAVKIPGIATIESDKTPWKDGTSEVIIDTKDISNTLRGMNEVMAKVLQNELAFSNNQKAFGENLKVHLETIQVMKGTTETMKDGLAQLSDAARALTQAANHLGGTPESATSQAAIEAPKEQPQARPTLEGWTQPEPQYRPEKSSNCIHGWTPEIVEQNYGTGLNCDRCSRVYSCQVLDKAYELARQKAKERKP